MWRRYWVHTCKWNPRDTPGHVLQDKVDDVGAGVKSTALLFGDRTKLVLTGFGGAMIGLLTITGEPHQGLGVAQRHQREKVGLFTTHGEP